MYMDGPGKPQDVSLGKERGFSSDETIHHLFRHTEISSGLIRNALIFRQIGTCASFFPL
jgi:hypothetical protein